LSLEFRKPRSSEIRIEAIMAHKIPPLEGLPEFHHDTLPAWRRRGGVLPFARQADTAGCKYFRLNYCRKTRHPWQDLAGGRRIL